MSDFCRWYNKNTHSLFLRCSLVLRLGLYLVLYNAELKGNLEMKYMHKRPCYYGGYIGVISNSWSTRANWACACTWHVARGSRLYNEPFIVYIYINILHKWICIIILNMLLTFNILSKFTDITDMAWYAFTLRDYGGTCIIHRHDIESGDWIYTNSNFTTVTSPFPVVATLLVWFPP